LACSKKSLILESSFFYIVEYFGLNTKPDTFGAD